MNNYTTKQCNCKHHIGDRVLSLDKFVTCTPSKTYPDGIKNTCKLCMSFIRKRERERNKDRIQKEQKSWREKNKEYISLKGKEYRHTEHGKQTRQECYERNREQKREYDKIRRQEVPGVREKYNATSAKYRAAKIQAIPLWFNDEKVEIDKVYTQSKWLAEQTGVPHHVDHIVPLQGKNVCGLHCLSNLQIIPAKENISKSNSWGD